MLNVKGITEQKAEKIYEAANKVESTGFLTGMQIMERRKKIKKISTGSRNFDILLCSSNYLMINIYVEGGIESMAITEAFGEFRTGKT